MNESYLAHHGVKGQKWGIRRFQNDDGSFTKAGKRRYKNQPGKDQISKPGTRRYIMDRGYNRTLNSREFKRTNAGAKIGLGLSGAAMGFLASSGAPTKTDRFLSAFVGYGIGSLVGDAATKGGAWLGSALGASLTDQSYVDSVERRIRNKVES